MLETIHYLIKNPDILEKVNHGQAGLIGLSEKQRKAITEVFNKGKDSKRTLWFW